MEIGLLRNVFLLLFIFIGMDAMPQDVVGLSYGHEYFPSAELVAPTRGLSELEIETRSWFLTGAFPFSLRDGRLQVHNKINYKKISFSYKNFPVGDPKIEDVQYLDYTLFLLDSLSDKWNFVAMFNPILASDFESKLSKDDMLIGGILGLINTKHENIDYGFGLAYMSDFGTPIPLPFLYIDWRPSRNLTINGIIPSHLRLDREMATWLNLGFEFSVDGNRFHGSPAKFAPARPFMRYSEGTFSSLALFHFKEWFHLSLSGGWGFYRNFEFYEDRNKLESFDLRKVAYFKTELILGF